MTYVSRIFREMMEENKSTTRESPPSRKAQSADKSNISKSETSKANVSLEGHNLYNGEVSLEKMANPVIINIPLPYEQEQGKDYKVTLRIRLSNSRKAVFKDLIQKGLKGRLSVIEFLVLDLLIHKNWKELMKAGKLVPAVLLLHSLGSASKSRKLNYGDKMERFYPSSKFTNFLQEEGIENSESSRNSYFQNLFKLSDKKVFNDNLVSFEIIRRECHKHPPRPYIGVGNDKTGNRSSESDPTPLILNGESSSQSFDLEVSRILSKY